jgi:single-strand DNA-binding protein
MANDSINKVILVGRLGRNPELKYTKDGQAIANFSVATSIEWKEKSSNEKKERIEWHRIVAFRKLGEICGQHLTKGRQVYVEGRLQTRSWEKDGETRYVTEIIATDMKMLGPKPDAHASHDEQSPPMESYPDEEIPDDIPF